MSSFALFKRAPRRVLLTTVATFALVGGTAVAASAAVPQAVPTAVAPAPGAIAPAAAGTTAFHPVAPGRLLDTRQGTPLASGATATLAAAGAAGMPAGIVAVVVNITATNTSAPGYLTAFPSGGTRPTTSVLNAERAGQTLANLATVPVGPDGKLSIFASATTDVIVDVFGYYAPAGSATAGRFVPAGPQRAYDSRTGGTPLTAGAIAHVPFAGILPADASAVVANLTVTEATAPGYWTAWPTGATRPLTSNLNSTAAGQTIANQIVVPVAAGGIDVFSQSGGHLVVDVTGYFTGSKSPSSSAGLYVPATPTRVLDTRTADLNPLGPAAQPQPGWSVEASISGYAAVSANVTLVHAMQAGYVTAYPAGTARPGASNLNATTPSQTIANQVITSLGERGLAMYVQAGGDVLVDVTGYYTGSPVASTVPPETNPAPPVPDRIVIPVAGIDIRVGYGVDPATLADGPGYWPGYGQLGQPGNVLIGAHRTSHGGPFERIDQIAPGSDIWVFAGPLRYHYVANDHFIVNYNQAEPVVRQTTNHELTLFACHPPGSEAQRYIVRAAEVRD
jgi:LPXTG-site transpeptidase (sortase) family protein